MSKNTKMNVNTIVEQLNFFTDSIKSEIVKTRDCNYNPKTGIYLEDKELEKTVFKPGARFRYRLDKNNKVLKIIPSNDIGTSVAEINRNGKMASVIHVRRKEILDVFKDYDKLEFEIFEDCILVKTKDLEENVQEKESIYKLSKSDVESLTDPSFDEDLRRAVAKHTKNNPILQKIYDVVKEPLKVVSLFSGIGAMDYAFSLEGFETQYCVEINKSACETINANLNVPVYNEDVCNINLEELGEADVLIGGTPCQDFSAMNSKKVWDSPKNKLVYKFIEAVKKIKAKVFLLENVPELITTKASHYINAIKEALPEFTITVGVLNSDEFGAAQSRERAYIIGSKIGNIDLPEPTTPINKVTVRDAFEGITSDMPNYYDWSKPTPKTVKRMEYVPQGGNYKDIPIELRTKGKFSNNFRRLDWNSQSCTIVNLGRTIIIHPNENRILSVREQARLFNIPDSWEFKGSMFDKQQQVANTVVINVVNAIAKKIKLKFEEVYDQILAKKFNINHI